MAIHLEQQIQLAHEARAGSLTSISDFSLERPGGALGVRFPSGFFAFDEYGSGQVYTSPAPREELRRAGFILVVNPS